MSRVRGRIFSVGAVNWKSVISIFILSFVISISIFRLAPSAGQGFSVVVSVVVVVLITALLLTARIRIEADALVAGGGFYRVRVPLQEIDVDAARIVQADDNFSLRWRSNGLGWPGLNLGWFSGTGSKRVFAVDTCRARRVLIPTSETFDLLLTPTDPARFLAALAEAKAEHAGCHN